MKAEDFINNNYHSKSGLDADKLIEDKTGTEVSFEEIAEAYHEHKLKLLGIHNIMLSLPTDEDCINAISKQVEDSGFKIINVKNGNEV